MAYEPVYKDREEERLFVGYGWFRRSVEYNQSTRRNSGTMRSGFQTPRVGLKDGNLELLHLTLG